MLGETVAYGAFSPETFDPAKAALVSALVALPLLTTALGAPAARSLGGVFREAAGLGSEPGPSDSESMPVRKRLLLSLSESAYLSRSVY